MDNAQITVVAGMLIQYATGFLTHKIGSDKVRKLIPIPLFIMSLLTQIVVGFQTASGAPATALHAGFFGNFGKGLLDILLNSIIQTLVVVGSHSAPKNVREGINLLNPPKPA